MELKISKKDIIENKKAYEDFQADGYYAINKHLIHIPGMDFATIFYVAFLADQFGYHKRQKTLRKGMFWLKTSFVEDQLNMRPRRLLKSKNILKNLGILKTKLLYYKKTQCTKEYYFVDFRILKNLTEAAKLRRTTGEVASTSAGTRDEHRDAQNVHHSRKTDKNKNSDSTLINTGEKEMEDSKTKTKKLKRRVMHKMYITENPSSTPMDTEQKDGRKKTIKTEDSYYKGNGNINIPINNSNKDINKKREKNNGKKETKLKFSAKQRAEKYLPLATKLSQIIQANKNISHNTAQLRSWANELRRLEEENGVTYSRMEDALLWYGDHIGEQYIPVIESGRSFREKFIRLEAAIDRANWKPKYPNQFQNRTGTSDDSPLTKHLLKIEAEAEEEARQNALRRAQNAKVM